MNKYGYINNLGELKLIQKSIYKGKGNYVGITKNGWAYIYNGTTSERLSKTELCSYLDLTPEQVDKVLKSKGTVKFDEPKKVEEVVNEKQEVGYLMKPKKKTSKKQSVSLDIEKDELDKMSSKNQIKYLRDKLVWLEENTVTKDQLIAVVAELMKDKS